jgi:hypothetical protein
MVARRDETPTELGAPAWVNAVELHDPERRRLLFVRGNWEVRSPPGCCALGPSWLLRGLWHLQFFAPASGLSILAFQSGSVMGPFLVRSGEGAEAIAMDAPALDQHLVIEWGLAPASHQMQNLVHLMEDKATSCLLRMRAGALARRNDNDRLRREMV